MGTVGMTMLVFWQYGDPLWWTALVPVSENVRKVQNLGLTVGYNLPAHGRCLKELRLYMQEKISRRTVQNENINDFNGRPTLFRLPGLVSILFRHFHSVLWPHKSCIKSVRWPLWWSLLRTKCETSSSLEFVLSWCSLVMLIMNFWNEYKMWWQQALCPSPLICIWFRLILMRQICLVDCERTRHPKAPLAPPSTIHRYPYLLCASGMV